MDQMHFTIASMGKPVIAMVHGYAVANGAGLMAAADFAIVAEGTQIGTTAINVGLLCTGPIIPMSYSLGKKKTLEMLLSGDMIDAKEAERLGLVNKVVPADKLEEETFVFAQKLITKSPLAIQIGKDFYYQMIDMPFHQRFVLNREVMTRLCTTEDALEGIDAFIEKRQPTWKGK
jgi:enoyl-CoA hydratase/carnithine racemase